MSTESLAEVRDVHRLERIGQSLSQRIGQPPTWAGTWDEHVGEVSEEEEEEEETILGFSEAQTILGLGYSWIKFERGDSWQLD